MVEQVDQTRRWRVSIENVFRHVNLRERAIALHQVASLATSGGCGLARLLIGESNADIRPLLQEGVSFLDHVLVDIEHHRFGVNVWSGQKICYLPDEVFKAFVDVDAYVCGRHVSKERLVEGIEEMEELARGLLPVFTILADSEDTHSALDKLVEDSKRYRKIKVPYLVVSSQAHHEFLHGYPPKFYFPSLR